jgi:mRNA interferase MazF
VRPIHLARVDKARPVVILTRESVRPYRTRVTVAPITSTVWGLSSEVPVGPANGLDDDSVINVDNVATIDRDSIGRLVGYLTAEQERQLAAAIAAAFDLQLTG